MIKMFPASFFKNIKNKIVPDIMETIFKLRSELEHKIDELKLELKVVKDITTDIGKDQHPPIFTEEELAKINDRLDKFDEFEKQVRRKKAFKRKDG